MREVILPEWMQMVLDKTIRPATKHVPFSKRFTNIVYNKHLHVMHEAFRDCLRKGGL